MTDLFRRRILAAGMAATLASPAPAVAQGNRKPAAAGRRRLAVALGSGSLHGHALIGVVRAFEEKHVRPDIIVGTSVGAIVGALWAAGIDSRTLERAAERFGFWRNVTLAWPRRGFFANDALEKNLRELLGTGPIESWRTKFAAVATDMATGERVVLDRGDAARAVTASATMPILAAPLLIGKRPLVDGALTEPVPAKVARELGGEFVVAVDIAYRPHDAPVASLADTAFQSLHILVNALINEQIESADVKIRLSLHPLMEDRKDYAEILLAAGRKATLEAWADIAAYAGRG
jgi:NTE family protein